MSHKRHATQSRSNGCLNSLGYLFDFMVFQTMIFMQIDQLLGRAPWKIPNIIHLIATVVFLGVHAWTRRRAVPKAATPPRPQSFGLWHWIDFFCVLGLALLIGYDELAGTILVQFTWLSIAEITLVLISATITVAKLIR